MAAHLDARSQVVRDHVTIFEVLDLYGVRHAGEGTQQIPCPVHEDSTPSARVYREQQNLYCFRCGKLWDVIGLVQAKERISFEQALDLLERRFTVPEVTEGLVARVKAQLRRPVPLNLDPLFAMAEQAILDARDRLALDRFSRALMALDLIGFAFTNKRLTPEDAVGQVKKILTYVR
jgi:DNA primase